MLPYNRNQVDTKQIADMLGLSHSYVRDRIIKSSDFPEPELALSPKTKRWNIKDVQDYIKKKSTEFRNRRR